MSIGETLEDIFGALNIGEALLGLFWSAVYRDSGHEFQIQRADKGGAMSFPDIERILGERGVKTYWYGYSGSKLTFRVKVRQAKWAEYVLLRAGVPLLNPAFDHRNATWAAQHKHGGKLPPAWKG